MLSDRVWSYVSHDLLRYVITHALAFVLPRYFSLCYVNFHFITLTQFACYISYAYSLFDFDICMC